MSYKIDCQRYTGLFAGLNPTRHNAIIIRTIVISKILVIVEAREIFKIFHLFISNY